MLKTKTSKGASSQFLFMENSNDDVYCYRVSGRNQARKLRKSLRKKLEEITLSDLDRECNMLFHADSFCIVPLTGTRL